MPGPGRVPHDLYNLALWMIQDSFCRDFFFAYSNGLTTLAITHNPRGWRTAHLVTIPEIVLQAELRFILKEGWPA